MNKYQTTSPAEHLISVFGEVMSPLTADAIVESLKGFCFSRRCDAAWEVLEDLPVGLSDLGIPDDEESEDIGDDDE